MSNSSNEIPTLFPHLNKVNVLIQAPPLIVKRTNEEAAYVG